MNRYIVEGVDRSQIDIVSGIGLRTGSSEDNRSSSY